MPPAIFTTTKGDHPMTHASVEQESPAVLVYDNCQSCGMPLRKSPGGGGTNADGSISTMYCAYCYVDGAFMQPDMTAEEMQAFVKVKMKEMGFPGFLGGFFTKRIPKLKRWSK